MKMKNLAIGLCLSGFALGVHPARAMNSPQSIGIDGGPLGSLQISGGADGYGYYLTGTGNGTVCNLNIYCPAGDKSAGAEVANYFMSI